MQQFIDVLKGLSDTEWNIVLAIVALLALSILFLVVNSFRAKKVARERMHKIQREAEWFFEDLKNNKKLTTVDVDVVLKEGELAIFGEPSTLYETRAYRLYGGGGTRIRGVYIGGGASESHQRLRKIDNGRLILTNFRLVFDGGTENRTLNLSDILSASPWSDAVEISTSRRQKSQIYSVENPIIWAQMIQRLASGNIALGNIVRQVPSTKTSGRDF